ncbi:MAG: hypothetical protein AAB415_00635, partial [Patescibacteria group bacterium]
MFTQYIKGSGQYVSYIEGGGASSYSVQWIQSIGTNRDLLWVVGDYGKTSGNLMTISTGNATFSGTGLNIDLGTNGAGNFIGDFVNFRNSAGTGGSGGPTKFKVDYKGLVYAADKIGIGTTTPNWLLQISTSTPSKAFLAITDMGASANLKHWTLSSQGGNFYIATSSDAYATSSVPAMMIGSNGNVGIGTTSPYAKLSLVESASGLRDVFVISTSTSGSVFRVDSYGQTFGDGAYSSPAADYAEYFYTNSANLKSGEVVCVDIIENNAVKRCERGADNNVMGIVSTKPSVIGNYIKAAQANPSHYAIIGMLGQVDAFVSAENGPINIGDSLTSASS